MVMTRVPVAAAGDALSVSTVDPEPGAPRLGEEKLAVTPAGMPVALNATAELNAGSPAIVSVTAALPPCGVVAVGALAVSVKPGGGVTVKASTAVRVSPPPFAVMVTERVVRGAVRLALSVSTLVPAPGAARLEGAKLAVTPVGKPLTENATGALNPLVPLTVTFAAALPACVMVSADTSVLMVNPGGGATVTDTGKVLVRPPPLAVTTRLYVPRAACAAALTVSVLVPDPGAGKLASDNFVVIPPGWPDTESATLELNPPLTPTLKPAVALVPCTTVMELVVPETARAGPPVTVMVSGTLCVAPPPVAVTCSV